MNGLRASRGGIRTKIGTCFLAALMGGASDGAFAACEFRAGSTTGAVVFPVLDPVTAPNVTSAIQLNVRCTPAGGYIGALWTFTSANGGALISR